MRGLASSGTVSIGDDVHVLLEHSNRGKQSLGLDLTSAGRARHPLPAGRDVRRLPHQQAAVGPQRSCKIDVDDIRAHNPDIIYVRGHRAGRPRSRRRPRLVRLARYWCRAGIALGVKQHGRQRAAAAGARIRRLDRRDDDRRRDHGRARSTASAPARRRSSTCRCSPPASGRWAPPWRCRCNTRQAWAAAGRRADHRQPARVELPHEGRALRVAVLPAGGEVLAEAVPRDRPARARRRRTLRRHAPPSAPTPGPRPRSSGRRSRSARSTSGASARRLLAASGPSSRTPSRPPPIRRRLRTATCMECTTADGTSRSSSCRRRCSTTASPRRTEAGAGVQRARRRDPGRPRPRLGHHHRPQDPRRRRLTPEIPPPNPKSLPQPEIPPPTRNPTQTETDLYPPEWDLPAGRVGVGLEAAFLTLASTSSTVAA